MVIKISHIYLDHLGLAVVDSLLEELVEILLMNRVWGTPRNSICLFVIVDGGMAGWLAGRLSSVARAP